MKRNRQRTPRKSKGPLSTDAGYAAALSKPEGPEGVSLAERLLGWALPEGQRPAGGATPGIALLLLLAGPTGPKTREAWRRAAVKTLGTAAEPALRQIRERKAGHNR